MHELISLVEVLVHHALNVDPLQRPVGREDVAVVHVAHVLGQGIARHQRHRLQRRRPSVNLQTKIRLFFHSFLM